VKPTALMRYLCRLITPPKGIVLDPFMGSGSTGKACVLEGFNFIGIEQDAEYCEIARARIRYAQEHGDSEGPKPEVTKKEGPTPTSTSEPTSTTKEQLTFFDFGKDSV